MAEGWIKLHRQIKEHWLWKSENRLKWWIDILLTVNHNDSKVLIKGTLIECKRGQSIRSLESWAKEWNVSKGAVRDFFKLLQSDQMLITESLQFTTRITVCKYEDYQTEVNTEKTQRKRKENAEETQALPKQEEKECKEEKELIKSDFLTKIIQTFQESYFEVFQNDYSILSKGKERAAAGKLLALYKKKNPDSGSEETLKSLKSYFTECCSIQDEWLQKNMSLSIIISKFNEINNTIRKSKNGRKQQERSVSERSGELDGAISAVFESKGM